MMDVDRPQPLIDAADPPEQGHETPETEAGWADLTARYNTLTGVEFIRLPASERAAATRTRGGSR